MEGAGYALAPCSVGVQMACLEGHFAHTPCSVGLPLAPSSWREISFLVAEPLYQRVEHKPQPQGATAVGDLAQNH